jgi:hypothetical protein
MSEKWVEQGRGSRAGAQADSRGAGATRLGLALVALAAACSNGIEPGEQEFELREAAVVVNSIGGTLSLVGRDPDGRFVARNDVVELGPAANAVNVAVAADADGDTVAAVPVGATDSLLVFEVDAADAMIRRRCAAGLTPGGSPSNATIANGKAYVTQLVSGEIARVDARTCRVEATAAVGPGPVDVKVFGGTVIVVVGNLDFSAGGFPARLGPSYLALLDPLTLAVEDTVGTMGFNAQFAAIDRDGELLVTNSGDFGAANGSIVVINPGARSVTAGPIPLGEFPAEIAIGPGNVAYVSSFSDGLYTFDAGSNQVVRGPEDPLRPPDDGGRRRGSSGVAIGARGQVLSTVFGDAATPGKIFLFDDSGALADSASVGVGPIGVATVPTLP